MAEIIILSVGGLCLLGSLCSLLVLIRNNWVYDARTKILRQEPAARGLYDYHRLPSYETMMKKFWIWDVKKFMSPVSTYPKEF